MDNIALIKYKKPASYAECYFILSIKTSMTEIPSIFFFFTFPNATWTGITGTISEYWLWILPDVTRYAHHVFKAFDVTGTGSISFKVS